MEVNECSSTPKPPRSRRPRAARACDLCRAKKNKCDESYPCAYCKSRNVTCIYQGSQHISRRYTAEYVKQLEEEVKRLSTTSAKQPSLQSVAQFNSSPSETAKPQHQTNSATQSNTCTFARDVCDARDGEISEMNHHTDGVEFYGNSSSFALLSRVQRSGQRSRDNENSAQLVSSLHNATFQTTPTASHGDRPDIDASRANYYPQCRRFIDNFFSTIHYIHPILDKPDFLQKCEALWSPNKEHTVPSPSPSFVALYYSILSLGAIVGVREEEHLDGLSNLQWSRKFFDISWTCCHQLGLVTNLEMVQCFFMLAKVCQNELNPHWSYMYIGFAVRTALAMGVNREPARMNRELSHLKAESRTWWGLYSLETEISFSIGRPDTLGADVYHNRKIPLVATDRVVDRTISEMLEPPHCAIIGIMVDLSRITRTICHKIYVSDPKIPDIIALTHDIETELDTWVEGLPPAIRPSFQHQTQQRPSLSSAKDAIWVKRQRLVLSIRYHNLKILLFGSLLIRSSPAERENIPGCLETTQKCLESARQTITIIYQTYAHNDFFQTWFYNATYTVFAASVILLYVTQGATNIDDLPSLFELVNMAVEILESMDESVVALQAAKLLRRAKDKAESRKEAYDATTCNEADPGDTHAESYMVDPLSGHNDGQSSQLNQYWGSLGLIESDGMDFDLSTQFGAFDQNNPMFLFLGDQ